MTAQRFSADKFVADLLARFAQLRADAILAAGPAPRPESWAEKLERWGTPIQTFEEACLERERAERSSGLTPGALGRPAAPLLPPPLGRRGLPRSGESRRWLHTS
jgi:hypothetical protein